MHAIRVVYKKKSLLNTLSISFKNEEEKKFLILLGLKKNQGYCHNK